MPKLAPAPLTTLITAALLALAGCANPVIMQSSQDAEIRSGVKGMFTYAAADRDMRTVIIGNPFPLLKAEVDRVITDTMQGRHFGPSTRFSTTPTETMRAGYSIVMMFNAPPGISKSNLCMNPRQAAPAPDGNRTRLFTGFCASSQLLSWVWASIDRVDTPEDPAFKNMVATSMWNLIPTTDDEPNGDQRDH